MTGAILSSVHDWHINLDDGAEVHAVVFDLQKAFDSVPHATLISKLSNLDIPSHLVAWISSYLCSRKQQVGVSGANSTTVDVISGLAEIPLPVAACQCLLMMFSSTWWFRACLISMICKATLTHLSSGSQIMILNSTSKIANRFYWKRVPTCTQTVVVDGLPLEKAQSYWGPDIPQPVIGQPCF